ncbi:MAG: ATP-dependent DNA helicase, partial [Candidatus Syntrophosphaera sp.]
MSDYILEHFPLLVNARLLDLSKQAQLDDTLYDFLYRIVEYQRRYVLIGKKPHIPDLAKPNVLENKENSINRIGIDEVFNSDGILSRQFPNFEFRSGQLEMAKEVETCFKNEKHLAVEAGTGVGKSFAYLVPAISFANRHDTKVVVSTNTKNLQEQLFYKDLPQLREMLPLPFKATLVKGRENYVCERRWEEFLMEQSRGITPWEALGLLYLFIWKYQTKSGDISENSSFDKNRFSLAWQKVCSDRFTCMGKKCPHHSKCYVMSLRKHIEDSSVVVTNHSLLLADLRMDNSTLGEYSYLVVDEAHNLMMTASKILGFELGYLSTINLLNHLDPSQKRKKTGFLHLLEKTLAKSAVPKSAVEHASNVSKKISEQIKDLRKILLDLFTLAGKLCLEADSYNKLRVKDTAAYPELFEIVGNLVIAWKNFIKELQALHNVFKSLSSKQVPNYESLDENLSGILMRAAETEFNILSVQNPDLENYALWIENYRPDKKVPSSLFCYAPVDVSEHLQKTLYEIVPSIVFTSATLALRGSFKYFFGQSGLELVPPEKIKALIVDSPFDYDSQSRLMVGSFLPEHKDRFFTNQALGCLEQLVTSTNVGTMILFTSYRDLNSVYDHLGETLYHSKRPFLAQGKGANRSTILEEFKSHKNAVLLGTNSFWEGVDIQGESLSLLILFKLPFQVPSEPIVEAYIDKLEREDKDSFMHYMLPNALLRLRQGFGRLIRSKADRGVVLIMDSRVSRKRYGHYFK